MIAIDNLKTLLYTKFINKRIKEYLMKYYAILPKEYLDTDDGKDYHVFESELVNGILKIKGKSGCGKVEATKKDISGFSKGITTFYYNKNFNKEKDERDYYIVNGKSIIYAREDNIRLIAASMGRKVCGQCVSGHLYENN